MSEQTPELPPKQPRLQELYPDMPHAGKVGTFSAAELREQRDWFRAKFEEAVELVARQEAARVDAAERHEVDLARAAEQDPSTLPYGGVQVITPGQLPTRIITDGTYWYVDQPDMRLGSQRRDSRGG